jgi:hypothetical protein
VLGGTQIQPTYPHNKNALSDQAGFYLSIVLGMAKPHGCSSANVSRRRRRRLRQLLCPPSLAVVLGFHYISIRAYAPELPGIDMMSVFVSAPCLR